MSRVFLISLSFNEVRDWLWVISKAKAGTQNIYYAPKDDNKRKGHNRVGHESLGFFAPLFIITLDNEESDGINHKHKKGKANQKRNKSIAEKSDDVRDIGL